MAEHILIDNLQYLNETGMTSEQQAILREAISSGLMYDIHELNEDIHENTYANAISYRKIDNK
jgi:hypothetical protein